MYVFPYIMPYIIPYIMFRAALAAVHNVGMGSLRPFGASGVAGGSVHNPVHNAVCELGYESLLAVHCFVYIHVPLCPLAQGALASLEV